MTQFQLIKTSLCKRRQLADFTYPLITKEKAIYKCKKLIVAHKWVLGVNNLEIICDRKVFL